MGGGSWRPIMSKIKNSGVSASTPQMPAIQKTTLANFIRASHSLFSLDLFAAGKSQADPQPDKNAAREPALQAGGAGALAQAIADVPGEKCDANVHQRAAGVEDQSQDGDLEDHGAAGGIDELRQKGNEEHSDFGIEHVGDYSLKEDPAQICRRKAVAGRECMVRVFAEQHPHAQVDQIGGAGITDDVVRRSRSSQQRGQPEGSGGDVHQASGKDTESRDHAGFAALSQAAAEDVEHVWPGSKIQGQGGDKKSQKISTVKHRITMNLEVVRFAKSSGRIQII